MRRVVLHMGLPKTGTTALQVWCVHHRDWLRGHGVHYPASRTDAKALRGVPVIGNGAPLLRCLTEQATERPRLAERAMAKVLAEVDGTDAPTVVFSNELLFRQHRRDLLRAFRC